MSVLAIVTLELVPLWGGNKSGDTPTKWYLAF